MGLGDERKWELPPRLQAGAQSAGDSLGARAEGPRLNDRRTPRRRSTNQVWKARLGDLAPPLLAPCSRLEELTTGLLPVARRVIALVTVGRTRGCEPRGRSRESNVAARCVPVRLSGAGHLSPGTRPGGRPRPRPRAPRADAIMAGGAARSSLLDRQHHGGRAPASRSTADPRRRSIERRDPSARGPSQGSCERPCTGGTGCRRAGSACPVQPLHRAVGSGSVAAHRSPPRARSNGRSTDRRGSGERRFARPGAKRAALAAGEPMRWPKATQRCDQENADGPSRHI